MYLDQNGFRHSAIQGSGRGPRLSPLERQVVMLSLGDPLSSLRKPSKWGARWRKLLRIELANPLADPRLEALRRFSVMMRTTGYSMPGEEYRRLIEAGFDEAIADEVYILTSQRHSAGTPPRLAGDSTLSRSAPATAA